MSVEDFIEAHDPEDFQIVVPKERNFEMLVNLQHLDFYLQNAYENFSADLLLNFSKGNMLFIDIGAHYGFYTLLLGTKFPDCKIISFEPAPQNFEILKMNLKINNLEKIEIYDFAVSDKNEIKDFNIGERSSQSGFYEHNMSKIIKTIQIKTITLDSFLKDALKVPTFIKIDTEGHEMCVLEGMKNILETTEDIKLLIEFNPELLKRAGNKPGDLFRKINHFGFDIYVIDDELRETYKLVENDFDHWDNYFNEGNYKRDYFNIFCIRKQKSLSICFFSNSSKLGRPEKCLLKLTTELMRNHDVLCSVVLPNEGPLRNEFKKIGASTLITNYSGWCDSHLPSDEKISFRLNMSYWNFSKIERKMRRINPDIIFTNTLVIPWGAISASLVGKPHVWFIHEFSQPDYDFKFFLSFKKILNIIMSSSNLILFNSDAVKETFFRDTIEKNVAFNHYYIDITPSTLKRDNKYFIRKNATKLLMYSHITESKGQRNAILAVRELVQRKKDVELVILGISESVFSKELIKIIEDEKLGEYVRIYDFNGNIHEIMDQADIVLICYENEAFGKPTLEAMFLKKPVKEADLGTAPKLKKERFNDTLFRLGDYKEFATQIEYIIDHIEKIEELEENDYLSSEENFTQEGNRGRVYKILNGLKNTKNPSSSALIQFMTHLEYPSVSIIIVNFNGEKYIRNCLNSVFSSHYPRFEIIVVDNASSDNSDTIVETEFPSAKLLRNNKNLGFAGGNNVGIKVASGDIVVLLNNDTIVEKGWLEGIVDTLASSDEIGIVGSKILYPDKKTIQHAGGIIHPNALTNHYDYGEEDNGQYNKMMDVDYVTGASIGIKKEVFKEVGFLEESYYPAYYEETEFCHRAKKHGYRVVYTPYSVLYHFESASIRLFSWRYLYYYHKNRIRFVLRNYSLRDFIFSFIPCEISWLIRILFFLPSYLFSRIKRK